MVPLGKNPPGTPAFFIYFSRWSVVDRNLLIAMATKAERMADVSIDCVNQISFTRLARITFFKSLITQY